MEVDAWPGISRDMKLAGWTLCTSKTTGKEYFWNTKTRGRLWPMPNVEGWGWTMVPDRMRPGKQMKIFVHLVTGKAVRDPPGGGTMRLSSNNPKKIKRIVSPKPNQSVGAHVPNNGNSTKKDVHKPNGPAAGLGTGDGADVSSDEDSEISDTGEDTNKSKKPAWAHIDLTPVKITDPTLLQAVDWRSNPNKWRNQKTSPHVMQAFNNNTVIYHSLSNLPFERSLRQDCPQAPYRRRQNEEKTVVNWSDRSLFLTELEFLIRFDKKTTEDLVIVVAGMGFSTCHIATLAEWIPAPQYHIFPDEGEQYLRARARIEKRHKHHVTWYDYPFDPERVLKEKPEAFYGRFVVLISNPKTYRATTDKAELMQRQLDWYQKLKPKAALLKFDLPWPASPSDTTSCTEFPVGDIRFPIFATPTGTECRMVTAGSMFSIAEKDEGFDEARSQTQMYNHIKYEGQMFHYNTCRRVSVYDHPVNGEGIDHCYDCTCEANILLAFVKRRHSKKPLEAQLSLVRQLTKKLSRDLADPRRPRTLNGFVGGDRAKPSSRPPRKRSAPN